MLRPTSKLLLFVLPLVLLGCNDVSQPIYGRDDPYIRAHVHFGSEHLQNCTTLTTPTATHDPAGILHVNLQIRSTVNDDLPIDVHYTFTRAGQIVDDGIMPTLYLHAQDYHNLVFNSTTAADDYSVTLSEAK